MAFFIPKGFLVPPFSSYFEFRVTHTALAPRSSPFLTLFNSTNDFLEATEDSQTFTSCISVFVTSHGIHHFLVQCKENICNILNFFVVVFLMSILTLLNSKLVKAS